MGLSAPFKRTCRQFTDGSYSNSGKYHYIFHTHFADNPIEYIRPFLLIQKDLQLLFDFVEPCDNNLSTYSFRIHELFIRTCIEIEANCKAILKENGYVKQNGDLNMNDYKLIEKTHMLSRYEIGLPIWKGALKIRKPFSGWKLNSSLGWYQAYNSVKHNRQKDFENASLSNLLESICGLVAILSAQFWTQDFIPSSSYLILNDNDPHGMESAIGGYFRVKFPNDWSEELRYDFSHDDINSPGFEIQCFNYNNL